MSEESNPSDEQADPGLFMFRIMEDRLAESVSREERIDFKGVQDSKRTHQIGRISMLFVLLLTPPVFFLIWTLVGAMGIITDRMEHMKVQVATMRGDFDEVATRMMAINKAVVRMSGNISVIPPMEKRLNGMRSDFDVITVSMGTISPDVATIDETLSVMDHDMAQMNQVFGLLNSNVFGMRRNVNRMSSPMRMFPFIGQ